jgi:tRNA dimethylallyltransferase
MPSGPANTLPPLLILIGATAVGKSALALTLASQFPLEIVSADSRLLYRKMDIGTAKPSPAERALVPHHLIDVADIDTHWSLADYLQAARGTIADITARSRIPFLVGGTGQYIRALREGWQLPPAAPDSSLRDALEARVEAEGADALVRDLARLDPESAAAIDPHNIRRVIRALEVMQFTGRTFAEQRRKDPLPFRMFFIGLRMPRDELHARADARIDSMLQAGWAEEVRSLLDWGYPPTLPAFSALGYREIIRHVRGELSAEECSTLIRYATHRYIRQQAAWFREDDPAFHWVEAEKNAWGEAETLIKNWLGSPLPDPPPKGRGNKFSK